MKRGIPPLRACRVRRTLPRGSQRTGLRDGRRAGAAAQCHTVRCAHRDSPCGGFTAGRCTQQARARDGPMQPADRGPRAQGAVGQCGILERLVAELADDFAARLHPAQPVPERCISVAMAALHAAASTRPGRCAAASMHCAGLAVGTVAAICATVAHHRRVRIQCGARYRAAGAREASLTGAGRAFRMKEKDAKARRMLADT